MRLIAAVIASLLAFSYWAHSMEIDLPPRAPGRPPFLRCDHCRERDADIFCDTCGHAFCPECEPAHELHTEVV